jgi:exodeoxyribonuclease-3
MRIRSWNINGMRAVMQKGFKRWLTSTAPDIVGVQEVRAHPAQLVAELNKLKAPFVHISPAERKGYSGVGLVANRAADSVVTSLGVAAYDVEGRVQMARFGRLLVVNVYVPNGNGKLRDNSRVPFKLAFKRRLFDLLENEKNQGGHILVMGDINTAHQEIDLARPKQNHQTSGFLPEERAELSRLLDRGWVDTFRHFEKGAGHYSWWSQRVGVRQKNIGWRIDLVLASPAAMPFITRAVIESTVTGSDHCPVGVDVDDDILR